MTLLLVKKAIVSAKYSDFSDIFLEDSANILSEQTGANDYMIKLKQCKQPFYRHIYNLEMVKLKIWRRRHQTNLANGFI